MCVKKIKSRLIYISKHYRKEWKMPPHINSPHKPNTILIERLDDEAPAETGPFLDNTSMFQAETNTMLPCTVDDPPSPPLLSQSMTPSNKIHTLDSLFRHIHPRKYKRLNEIHKQ